VRRILGVSFVLVTILTCALPASGQDTGSGSGESADGFSLGQNYPNPFNPETTIPFVLSEELFESGRPVVVSLRIYNLLHQPVASPVALRHPAGEGVSVSQLEYVAPGRYEARWDGRDFGGNRVPSGIYFAQIDVNGQRQFRRMFVTK